MALVAGGRSAVWCEASEHSAGVLCLLMRWSRGDAGRDVLPFGLVGYCDSGCRDLARVGVDTRQ